MTIVLSTPPYQQFYDDNGAPLNTGLIYTYVAGGLTPTPTYTDQGGLTECSNPIELDSAGRAVFWLDSAVSYKFIIKTSTGVTIRTVDTVTPFNNQTGLAVLGNIAANTLVGNNTGGAAAPTALTVSQVNAMLQNNNAGAYRNYLINGDFSVWQRGTTYALTTSLAYGSADRWAVVMQTSAAGIANRDTSPVTAVGFKYDLKMGRTAASVLTTYIQAIQVIESKNALQLAGKDITISFYAKAGANLSNALHANIVYGTGTDESAASMVAGGWTGFNNSNDFTPTLTTSWARYQQTFALSSTATEVGLNLYYLTTGTAGTDDNIYITGVQLEIGTVATPFEFRPFATELDLCRYYYEKSFPYATAPAQSAAVTGSEAVYLPTGASGTFGTTIPMLPKRTAPAITTYNPSAGNANWRDTTNNADRTVTVSEIGDNSFVVSGASGIAASVNRLHWAATAEY